MRIANITFSTPIYSFQAKHKKKNGIYNNQNQQDRYDEKQEWMFYEPSKPSKKAQLQMDLLKILSVPKTQNAVHVSKPFEQTDKKLILDKYQQKAIDSFKNGDNVIVTAPTGTGKTLIAEYAIEDAVKKGKRIIYLSPLKALSNEKFKKFSELFGEYDDKGNLINSDNVGIITGDVSINPDAQFLVMTTEIYRNMLAGMTQKEAEQKFSDFLGVIYDEFHYLQDRQRGTVWEESVIMTPEHMQQMMLSATASNAKEFVTWMEKLNPTLKTTLVNVDESERYVPLKEYVFVHNKKDAPYKLYSLKNHHINIKKAKNIKSERVQVAIKELEEYCGQNLDEIFKELKCPTLEDSQTFASKLVKRKGIRKEKAQQYALLLSDNQTKITDIKAHFASGKPSIPQLSKILKDENKVPALFFIFSKRGCKKALEQTVKENGSLLTKQEARRVYDIIEETKKKGIYLGKDFDEEYYSYLLKGYAVHHAGMLPAYKSLIETLSQEGLIKNCFATETLLAGINMPFKTVVFTSAEKMSTFGRVPLTPAEYKQGAGRAGRRGIDDVGNVILMPNSFDEFDLFIKLANSKDTSINSALYPYYSMALQEKNLNAQDEYLKKSLYVHQHGRYQEIKSELSRKTQYLQECHYIEENNGVLKLTQKGKIAKNIYGINPILMTEIMTNKYYTQDLSPAELAGLITIFSDIKDKNPQTTFNIGLRRLEKLYTPVMELAQQINKDQSERNIQDEIKMSTSLVESIIEFSSCSKEDSLECWNEIFNNLVEDDILLHEGDLLRVVNETLDNLQKIALYASDKELRNKAIEASKSLKKPPVTDIVKQELDEE